MSWPNGVTLVTGSVGDSIGASGESADRLYVAVAPVFGEGVHRLLHAATGTVWDNRAVVVSGSPTLFVQVPVTDQTGFVDGAGNEVTGWYYVVEVIARSGRRSSRWSYDWQPVAADGANVDLDTLGDGVIVTDPTVIYAPARDALAAREAAAAAAASAADAAGSVTAVAGYATAAAGSASGAALSAQEAADSVTDALAAAAESESSANDSADSATLAAGSATDAAGSVAAVASSASAAAGSASAAAGSATSAGNSATAAAGSASAAASTLASAVTKSATATSGALGISPNPANQVGPNADNYFVVGGETTFPNAIGDARLAHVMGYDDKVWDKSIAAMVLGFHCIVGGSSGHETVGGGTMHAVFGGYSTVPGGLGNRTVAAKAVVSGDSNTAGANAIAALTVAVTVGATTLTVDDPTGIAAGQIAYLGVGTPALNANTEGPLERATVASIAGSVITLNTFQSVSTTGTDGLSTGTAFAAAHPVGARVLFSDGTNTGCTVCGGFLNDAMGVNATVVGGRGNQSTADYSTASGYYTKAAGTYSRSSGRYSVARTSGQVAHAAGRFATSGDTQISRLHVFGTTTDGSTAVALNPSGSGGTMHQLTRGQVVAVSAHIVGQSSDGTVRAHYIVDHTAQFAAAGNSVWLGSPMIRTVYEDAGIGGVSFSAGSSVGSVNVKATGKAATTMKWTGRVELTEVAV